MNDVNISISSNIWKLIWKATATDIGLTNQIWGSLFIEHLSNTNLIPFKYISAITLAYQQHLQEKGGEITALLSSAIVTAESTSTNDEPVLVLIVPLGLPSELHQCAPEYVLVVDSEATVHCLWDAICTSYLKEQNSVIGGIDVDSRAVCIAIGNPFGLTFCRNKDKGWYKVLITSGNHDAWVIPTSSRMLFSQIRAKIQGHRCILEGPNPGLIIGDSVDFIPFVLEEQT